MRSWTIFKQGVGYKMLKKRIWLKDVRKSGDGNRFLGIGHQCLLACLFFALLLAGSSPSYAILQSSPNALENFPGDYYKLDGGPDLIATLEKSTLYQKESTSLFLTLKNRGIINSIKVNEEPSSSLPEEVYAAKLELDLEHAKTTAQDISVSLTMPFSANESPLEIKSEVAYAGSLKEGQISNMLAFPVEVYKKAVPGDYTLYATVNYTYQQDVAVKPYSGRPQNPDIYYLYQSASQVVPLQLHIARRSGAEFEVLNMTPASLQIGSKENVIKMAVENIGHDTAYDLVARLRPESGIYVSIDDSPIPALAPGEKAELVYKIDVSKDAVAGKRYMLDILFDFSDSFRENMTDTEHAYLMVKSGGFSTSTVVGVLATVVAAAAIVQLLRKRRGSR
jgi:hypothetical protein